MYSLLFGLSTWRCGGGIVGGGFLGGGGLLVGHYGHFVFLRSWFVVWKCPSPPERAVDDSTFRQLIG